MKKFRFYFSLICMIFVLLPLQAKKVEADKAVSVAQNCVQSMNKLRAANDIRLKYVATNRNRQGNAFRAQDASVQDTVYYYVFNVNESAGGGFVIVAGDDAVRPVLGYSDKGSFDENNLPPNFAWWMDELQKQIVYAQAHNLPQSKAVGDEWNSYLNGTVSSSTSSAGPLIQTQWNQMAPYNNLCPVSPDGYHYVTGCVATAMAQIMKYYIFPTQGSGQSPAYNTSYGVFVPSANFEINYDWANMLNTYTGNETPQQQNAVATLLYHCGSSVRMAYGGPDGSAAFSSDMLYALKTYFGYNQGMQYNHRSDYSDANWEALLKAQIDARIPVFYEGSGVGAHAFICDGYDNTGLFHFNWGWGGYCDGYFVTTALEVGGYNFSSGQSIITDIKPIKGMLKGLTVSAGTLSPAFRPYIFDYSVQVDASVASINVTGTTDIPGATVTGNVTNLPLKLNDVTYVTLTVTDPSGHRQQYTVAIARGTVPPVSFTWKIDNAEQYVYFNLKVLAGHSAVVDWGDGTAQDVLTANYYINDYSPSHTYSAAGTYQVSISKTGNDLTCPLISLESSPYNGVHFTQIDVHTAHLLQSLSVGGGALSNLDVSQNVALIKLWCGNNQLTNLDISKNTALSDLSCSNNQLATLDVSKNTALTSLECYSNQLANLDVSHNPALTTLNCYSNQLTNLDVSQNIALISLGCDNNQLTNLNVSNNTALSSLNCNNNQIVNLNVSNCTALTHLNCYSNQLTNLDVSRNIALTDLGCNDNQLTNLDVNHNLALSQLNCSNNHLTNLNISNCTVLSSVYCYNNQLTNLDISNNTALTFLYCANNAIPLANLYALSQNLDNLGVNINSKFLGKQVLPNVTVMYNTPVAIDTVFHGVNSTITVPTNSSISNGIITFLATGNYEIYVSNPAITSSYPYAGIIQTFTVITYQTNVDITADFTDPNFLTAVYEYTGKTAPDPIYGSDVEKITSLNVSNRNIQSLAGLEHFLSLTTLNCSNNQLTNLEIHNPALTNLVCNDNQLTNLDVSQNTTLVTLNCQNNQLANLGVNQNTALTDLQCANNQLTNLDVSQNVALTSLWCDENQLTNLDVSHSPLLSQLGCSYNQVVSLNISNCIALSLLYCNNNQLTNLDVSHNSALSYLSCRANCIPLYNLYELSQAGNFYKDLSSQHLPDMTVSINTPIAIDTVFNGVSSNIYVRFNENPYSTTDYTLNNGIITFLTLGAYSVTVNNPAISYDDCILQNFTVLSQIITLNKSILSLDTGNSEQLIATITPVEAANQAITWSSDNTAVAIVSADGTITAIAPGTATVTATTQDGSYAATCTVTVTQTVTGISLNKSTLALTVGGSEQLIATVSPSGAIQAVIWSSDNTAVATVSADGTVMAIAQGTATITATTQDSNFTATCKVTVTPPSGIGDAPQIKSLKAWVQNGTLHVSGLTVGNAWAVYNMSGILMYRHIAESEEASVSLPVRGVYFVQSDKETIKTAY